MKSKLFKSKFDREKFGTLLIYLIENTKNTGITKLNKLLYFIDFLSFKKTGMPITNNNYIALKFGPVPQPFYNECQEAGKSVGKDVKIPDELNDYVDSELIVNDEENKFLEITTKKTFDPEYFTEEELNILNCISQKYKDVNSKQIVDDSHKSKPYDNAFKKGINTPIKFIDVLEDTDYFGKESSLTKDYLQECQTELACLGKA